MGRPGLILWVVVCVMIPALGLAQEQACPINGNFSTGTLTHWMAYTGNNRGGNGPGAILTVYDSVLSAPSGTYGATAFSEYNFPRTGIQIMTSQGKDPFGDFDILPTINGYAYRYAILLGSTAVSQGQARDPVTGQPIAGSPGGYVRGISYKINVPAGPPTLPYTMTYAYAMVLENGTHASEAQPMSRAIVSTPAGVIDCASPAYFLPTNGGLDSATARANGFSPSPIPTPNASRNPQDSGKYLQDVWTKGWTEVTFDLTAYRGQQVTLTFEADNCVPGGHFSYAYFALRDVCAGLQISGDSLVCTNAIGKYSIPSLNGASYEWEVPPGWKIESGNDGNNLSVKAGPQPGWIVARETNSCTSLTDSLFVKLYRGALPEAIIHPRDTTICHDGEAQLHALVTTGTEYTWKSSGPFTGNSKGSFSSAPFVTDIVAAPAQTTDYILNLLNDGCPIPVYDTFKVTVVQPILVYPGNDTLVVVNQPLHFSATSNDIYKDEYRWSPSLGLDNPDIANPVGRYGLGIDSITYLVTATDSFGCYGTASVKVRIANTLPDIFVPNAFTPGKGSNSVFRPICIGIASLEYFQVFNRWGQLLFSTSRMGQGWDGRIQGILQASSAYYWTARGIDYTGRVILKKGSVVLLR
ncbi:MAG: gliding motility-associated C-terminal domain-containing protein [Bacteroidetes bacterium]|nr:gliding motility-associated C-terminal domain-containing protein [Bacteroidota bacterium]